MESTQLSVFFHILFWSTEEEEEEEIAAPQPAVVTPTEKPDQKEEEEGTSLPMKLSLFSSSRNFTISFIIVNAENKEVSIPVKQWITFHNDPERRITSIHFIVFFSSV